MSYPNPFPAYPVRRLEEDPASVLPWTTDTDAIKRSRQLLDPYINQWQAKRNIDRWQDEERDDRNKVPPVFVAVKGDFGSGKTHLLLDAMARVQRELSEAYPDAAILRFPCVESTPEEWFQTTIGPALNPDSEENGFVRDCIVRLYARAGGRVAEQAKMTVSAKGKLQEDPYLVYDLIKEDLLNVTAVDQAFQALLRDICSDVSEDVRRALESLMWPRTSSAAARWLAGEMLDPEQVDKLGVDRPSFSTENTARDVLVALAAIHSRLNRPFGLMIDELEHFTRFDQAHHSKHNLTWLKRLLERLAEHQTLAYVAGHWKAWEARLEEGEGDFLERFSNEVMLSKLSPDDVLNIVSARVEDLPSKHFGRPQAEAVLKFVDTSSIRSILSLCRVLFRESDGFRTVLSEERIGQLALQDKQRVTIRNVPLYVRQVFEERDLAVRQDAPVTKNIPFDLVAYQHGQPRVIVSFKHAFVEADQIRQAARFVIQVREVHQDFPEAIACFISDGSVDVEATNIFRSALGVNILSFDLNEPGFIAKFRESLDLALNVESRSADETQRAQLRGALEERARLEEREKAARSNEDLELVELLQSKGAALERQVDELRQRLTARAAELEQTLTTLQQQRSAEYREQQARQSERASLLDSQRDAEVATAQYLEEEIYARIHNTYSELTKPVNLSARLRWALEGRTLRGLFLFISLALIAVFATPLLLTEGDYFRPEELVLRRTIASVLYVVAAFCALCAIFIVWRSLSAVDTYLDYSARMLREVYIRSPSPQYLIKAHNILRDSLEERGPFFGREWARDRLARSMPEYFDESDPDEPYDRYRS